MSAKVAVLGGRLGRLVCQWLQCWTNRLSSFLVTKTMTKAAAARSPRALASSWGPTVRDRRGSEARPGIGKPEVRGFESRRRQSFSTSKTLFESTNFLFYLIVSLIKKQITLLPPVYICGIMYLISINRSKGCRLTRQLSPELNDK